MNADRLSSHHSSRRHGVGLRRPSGRGAAWAAIAAGVAVVAIATVVVVENRSEGRRDTIDEPARSTTSPSDKPTTTVRDYTATTGPNCTVGTIPTGMAVPSGCDRLYSPPLSPGRSCVEGQDSDCIDPDGNGFTFIVGGGRCLVERKDPERCRDNDGDGRLDEPLPG